MHEFAGKSGQCKSTECVLIFKGDHYCLERLSATVMNLRALREVDGVRVAGGSSAATSKDSERSRGNSKSRGSSQVIVPEREASAGRPAVPSVGGKTHHLASSSKTRVIESDSESGSYSESGSSSDSESGSESGSDSASGSDSESGSESGSDSSDDRDAEALINQL